MQLGLARGARSLDADTRRPRVRPSIAVRSRGGEAGVRIDRRTARSRGRRRMRFWPTTRRSPAAWGCEAGSVLGTQSRCPIPTASRAWWLPMLVRGSAIVLPDEDGPLGPSPGSLRTRGPRFFHGSSLLAGTDPHVAPALLAPLCPAGSRPAHPLPPSTAVRFRETFGQPVHVFDARARVEESAMTATEQPPSVAPSGPPLTASGSVLSRRKAESPARA